MPETIVSVAKLVITILVGLISYDFRWHAVCKKCTEFTTAFDGFTFSSFLRL